MKQVQTMACGSCTIENGLKAMFIAHEVIRLLIDFNQLKFYQFVILRFISVFLSINILIVIMIKRRMFSEEAERGSATYTGGDDLLHV